MNKDCFIAQDLLPLYNEGLLQPETAEWLEAHLKVCVDCQELAVLSEEPIDKADLAPSMDSEKMLKKINLQLSIYQIIFVAISFLFAIKTSLFNESFGFILTYTVLGLVTYLFYKRFSIVVAIAFLPGFLWALFDLDHFHPTALLGAIFFAGIHLLFAIAGSLIGLLIVQMKERG